MKNLQGTILRVDLSSGTIEKEPLTEELRLKYVGGRGINVKILFEEVGAGIDPLSPDSSVCSSLLTLTIQALSNTCSFTGRMQMSLVA